VTVPEPAPLRLGIVGCGAIAQRMYAVTLPRVAEIRATRVCDTDPAAARALAHRLDARPSSLDELCAETDVVLIATPPATHRELVARCLRPGRIVVCEKPFVATGAEAAELVAQADRQGSALHVAHFRRTYPSVQLVRGLIASGEHGPVRRIEVHEGGRFDWGPRSDYVTRDAMGGVLFDTGSHSLDMALYAAGLDAEALSIEVRRVQRERPEPAHEIAAEFTVQGGFGAVEVALRLSRYQSLANRIHFGLERATIDLSTLLRGAVRLTRPDHSVILRGDGATNPFDCFVEQWRAIFRSPRDNAFQARRFVGLAGVLEALST
jgi:predicted dehydrogenase